MAPSSGISTINCRYLLVCPIPFFLDSDDSVWLDELWHHDLMEHLVYLEKITVIAPVQKKGNQKDLKRVLVPNGRALTFRPLPDSGNYLKALLRFPQTFVSLVRAVSSVDIVHSGVVGWPFPYGLVANPLALLLRKSLIIVIESSPWRINDGQLVGPTAWMRAWTTEAFARWSVRKSHLAVFTSTAYKESLGMGMKGMALVAPATWINEADILSDSVAAAVWAEKSGEPKFIFAGRLTVQKGLLTLLDALSELDRQGVSMQVDIIGQGEMQSVCEQRLAELKHVRANILPIVPYGEAFFGVIRNYDAVIVPSLSDEQPRIIFDAYSQALPVIASATPGHRDCVQDNTGEMVPVDDSLALANLLKSLVGRRDDLCRFGMAARETALNHTHKSMHEVRAELIRDLCRKRHRGF